MQSENLILELIEVTRKNLNFATLLKQKSDNDLNWKKDSESWSVLECLEHLNLYGNYYIPEFEKTIKNAKTQSEIQFESSVLGNYFAESLLPKEKLNRMKTFKNKNPLNSDLNKKGIDRFITQQIQIIDLLNKSRKVSLNKERIKISITKWIKLKLGDTFRVVINHNVRHIKQIERILEAQ